MLLFNANATVKKEKIINELMNKYIVFDIDGKPLRDCTLQELEDELRRLKEETV